MPEFSSPCHRNFLRVTEVLYPFSGLDAIDPAVVANAGRRGTKVHKICEAIMTGLGEMGVDDEAQPYVDSFYSWWNTRPKIVEVEKRFYNHEHKITGQCDAIIEIPNGQAIIDLKTSSKESKTWPVQGSAYAWLANQAGHTIKKIFFIHLLKTGKPAKIKEYPVDESLFLSVLRTYNHFYRRNK